MGAIMVERIPSNRSFGFFLIVCCLGFSVYLFFIKNYFAVGISLLTLIILSIVSTLCPKILYPQNIAWFKLGKLLGRFINPFVMSILYFLVLTPVAVFLRFLGRDELEISFKKKFSYWKSKNIENVFYRLKNRLSLIEFMNYYFNMSIFMKYTNYYFYFSKKYNK